MIEHLKNIGNGLWYIGIACACGSAFYGLGYLTLKYPFILTPFWAIGVTWFIGKFMRS